MTYNRTEIMTRAWALNRTGNYGSFAACLRQSWRETKKVADMRAQGYVMANELSVGDTIAVDGYGGYDDNNFSAVVTEIKTYNAHGKDHVVVYFNLNGYKNDICMEAKEMIIRTSPATQAVA